jgi:N-acetylglutamate synthase-like GNAT family acetyltransferase
MIEIRRARQSDLPGVQYLTLKAGKMTVTEDHINHRDISLVAYDEERLVGFLWMGLMCRGKYGYIDKFLVDKDYSKKGVGNMLAIAMMREGLKRGVRDVFGIIKQDKFHEASGFNALKMAFGADSVPYTFVTANAANMVNELKAMEKI